MEFLKKGRIIAVIIATMLFVLIGAGAAFVVDEKELSENIAGSSEIVIEKVSESTELSHHENSLPDSIPGVQEDDGEGSTETIMEVPVLEEVILSEKMNLTETDIPMEEIALPEKAAPSAETEQSAKKELPEKHVCRYEKLETSATCLTAGKVEEKCLECGKVNSEETIEPLDHDFRKSIWETATCLKGGYYNNVCQRCGLVENTTEEPLPHDVEDIVVQEGNCMEDTIIRHICKSCGLQVESDTRFTPQTHKWVDGVIDGEEVSYCEWCSVVR